MPDSMPFVVLLAPLIGIIAGLRTMMAPTAVSWAAALGWLDVSGTWLAFLGYTWTPWILSALAAVELVGDQLPSTPHRTVPVQFGARLASGALAGAAIGAASGPLVIGAGQAAPPLAGRLSAALHQTTRASASMSIASTGRPRCPDLTCCLRSAAPPTPMTSGLKAPASPSTSTATSRWTTSSPRTSPAFGRSATATAAAPSPTPRTTTSRSSRRTSSTAPRAA
jgi:uncharacterized membrane protein